MCVCIYIYIYIYICVSLFFICIVICIVVCMFTDRVDMSSRPCGMRRYPGGTTCLRLLVCRGLFFKRGE